MAKRILLYNLKENVTDQDYAEYCRNKKGPFLKSLPSCRKYTLVKVVASQKGEIPFKYVGVVDITNDADWERDRSSEGFQDFLKEWTPKVAEVHMLVGVEVFEE